MVRKTELKRGFINWAKTWFYKPNLSQQKPNHKIDKIEAVIQLSYIIKCVEKLAKKQPQSISIFYLF